ncbi:N-acetylmuramoyl-L-alanine amidase [Spirosoma lacussanchae]|uniref:N-acetylmuramoyl-L-alanine amidase family protein n=1 Tax=Spirosoma lacussanchae TaxID=1884249 RepID=UPI001107D70C|nr:N-acetylmuramoyl-L-alanine amidase [Spirosoma lacussanchae]
MKAFNWLSVSAFALIHTGLVAQTPVLRDTLLTGYTRTALTPLYYGQGTDRLGGARMETLDSGVVLRITGLDTMSRLWRVRLSPTLSAFVPTDQITADTLTARQPGSARFINNWTVSGDSTRPFDYVAVRLPARLPYRSQIHNDPGQLIVDVFGATANTNWITQLASATEVKRVWFEQLADETVRINIDLKHRQPWGYAIYYQRNTLLIRVRRPPRRPRLRDLAIAVDAGHGGSNTGARGQQTGKLEKEMTLDVALRLQRLLERAGSQVLMTRAIDTLLGPTARILAMRRAQPNLLVSIHFNSAGNAGVRGVSTYYKHPGFRPLSQHILHELLQIRTNDGHPNEFGNIGHFNFFFNAPTDYPNVLVEGPFLSNPADEALITDRRFRHRMAKAIRRGIRKFLADSAR